MDFDESSDEEEPTPRYSKILKEEEYEDGSGLENNFESQQVDVVPWDPREPSFFFPIN